MFTKVKTNQEIEAMRISGGMLAQVLDLITKKIVVGMSSKDLADIAARELKALGGKPAFLGYQGFPDVLCVSINDEVVHGIPSPARYLKDGDVVSLDFGVSYDGMITDAARTVLLGDQPKKVINLVHETALSLQAGIQVLCNGVTTGDIGAAVEAVLSKGGYGIVRDLVGHGVGHHLHEEPNIPNLGIKGQGFHLKAGMTIAIEPMATLGGYQVKVDSDGWTVRTMDNSLAAHFEDTILITEEGPEILTRLTD